MTDLIGRLRKWWAGPEQPDSEAIRQQIGAWRHMLHEKQPNIAKEEDQAIRHIEDRLERLEQGIVAEMDNGSPLLLRQFFWEVGRLRELLAVSSAGLFDPEVQYYLRGASQGSLVTTIEACPTSSTLQTAAGRAQRAMTDGLVKIQRWSTGVAA